MMMAVPAMAAVMCIGGTDAADQNGNREQTKNDALHKQLPCSRLKRPLTEATTGAPHVDGLI
jgi:hypothetical protein